MSGLRLIQIPYDSGIRGRRMGRGPFHLVENGALDVVGGILDDVESVVIEYHAAFPIEIETTFGLHREIARAVRRSLEQGQFPLLFSGNCSSTVGAMGGFGNRKLALLWFDAHGDLHTPATTTTGFLDGMPVAMVIGACWQALTRSIPGFRALPERQVALVGARDLEEAERIRLEKSAMQLVTPSSLRERGAEEALASVCDAWVGQVEGIYVHIDMDVHDPALAPVNSYQPPGGLFPEEVRTCIRHVADRFRIVGASITAYDPDCDRDGKGLNTGMALVLLLAEIAKRQGT